MRVSPMLWTVAVLSACATAYGPDDESGSPSDPAGSVDAAPGGGGGGGGGGADGSTTTGPIDAAEASTFRVTVTLTGTGTGTVSSSPSGVTCSGSSCTGSFAPGTPVTLTATPQGASAFAGFSGGCTGTGPCSITVNNDIS